ncbi:diacylglycerol kinase family protein [Streptomyces racemochromogenes]|uniref:Diacylglycerol kinase family protein n=1 Tax=Streptomyces racemochromogenes TaxID=67353 RepID=A0ABW7PAF9_9ACTN
MSHAGAPVGGLLVLVDPVARRLDGESVRIAKDVLSAGAAAKICLPDSQEEFARALARRGHRRPVVVGDDGALVRAVGLLYGEPGAGDAAVSLVPVGAVGSLALARSLGVPLSVVFAARAALDGVTRPRDLLVDDCGGVVLGGLRITAPSVSAARRTGGYRSLLRTLLPAQAAAPGAGPGAGRPVQRLRVEVDGVVLVDEDRPVEDVAVRPREDGGPARVVVRVRGGAPLTGYGDAVTVSVTGPAAAFHYRADHAQPGAPARRRTWTRHPSAWSLTLPRGPGSSGPAGL